VTILEASAITSADVAFARYSNVVALFARRRQSIGQYPIQQARPHTQQSQGYLLVEGRPP